MYVSSREQVYRCTSVLQAKHVGLVRSFKKDRTHISYQNTVRKVLNTIKTLSKVFIPELVLAPHGCSYSPLLVIGPKLFQGSPKMICHCLRAKSSRTLETTSLFRLHFEFLKLPSRDLNVNQCEIHNMWDRMHYSSYGV